jgi:hypothetical protein
MPRCDGIISLVAARRGLLKRLLRRRLIRRGDVALEPQVIQNFPSCVTKSARFHLLAVRLIRRAFSIPKLASRRAPVACPLRESRHATQSFPTARSNRGKRAHSAETIAPGDQERVFVRFAEQFGARLR